MKLSLEFITTLARGAGNILCENINNEHILDYKGPTNIVTEVDKKSEDFIVGEILKSFPGHSIVAEEGGKTTGEQGNYWYIDPIDGTSNYSRGLPMFCVSIAYAEDSQMKFGCVYDPVRKEFFTAEKGRGAWLNGKPIQVSKTNKLIDAMLVTGFPYDIHQKNNNLDHFNEIIKEVHTVRRLGSAALDLAYVAMGRLDGYWEIGIGPWDIAAGALIVEEAGGRVTTLQGKIDYMVPPYAALASNGLLHDRLLGFFKP